LQAERDARRLAKYPVLKADLKELKVELNTARKVIPLMEKQLLETQSHRANAEKIKTGVIRGGKLTNNSPTFINGSPSNSLRV
jgi:hypothetical protein